MTVKPETRLQRRYQERLRLEFPGCYVRKIHGNEFQHGGIPDLICCIYGVFIAIECKVGCNDQSALQKEEAMAIRRGGGHVFVGYDYNLQDVIDNITVAVSPNAMGR